MLATAPAPTIILNLASASASGSGNGRTIPHIRTIVLIGVLVGFVLMRL
jgi:hypothetical protein